MKFVNLAIREVLYTKNKTKNSELEKIPSPTALSILGFFVFFLPSLYEGIHTSPF